MEKTKLLMKDFHYNCSKNDYCGNVGMLLTDTDSVVYKIEAENAFDVFKKLKSYLTSAIIQKNQIIMIIQVTQL